ncbi:MAG: ABC transporter ATP-binding protein [Hyphomicrobiales bacterium]|nr:ABC transporter ATP-binding protein [Hyphomicrobiales bacterium]
MLEVRDMIAGYGQVEVLHGVSLDIKSGEIVALLGSNGAGKSTFNNNISGIYRPFGGTVVFEGQDILGAPSETTVDRGIIQVPEGRRVFPNMSVRENLEMGAYLRARERRSENLDKVTAIFPRLAERIGQLAGTLSGGEQQMLAIGRGLMAEPRLLILDEPSLGLSPLLVEEMFTLIRRLHADGLSIFLVEQNVVQSLEIADRAYVLENGRIAMAGAADTLMNDQDLRRSYLGM